ncbi:MAG: sodium:calcium antiporter [Desulfobacteraceae bacterium]|jgi:cation:H+ antiporter|nr:MAG: sodium:calcium antiporter [Desulfobacteraceae bacterium]
MLFYLLLFSTGLLLLYFGSSWLVNGASDLALSFAIRPAVVGLTVVAFATSAPELLVSMVAAHQQSSGISVGNILGSNVINIALVLGLSALIKPVTINIDAVSKEIPYLVAVSLLFWGLGFDGDISRTDGVILTLALILFLTYSILTSRNGQNGEDKHKTTLTGMRFIWRIAMIFGGIVALAVGAKWVVDAAIFTARSFQFSELFIGISVVAVGTSLPELATSITAAIRGQSDISVGNITGSNLFNICLVMGVVGMFTPISFDTALNRFEFPFMVLLTLMLYYFAARHGRIGRRAGLVFLMGFVIYNGLAYHLAH